MTPITTIQRYVWLLNELMTYGALSIDEINDKWARSDINYAGECEIPRRTFFRMKNSIESIFDVTVNYNSRTKKYSLDEGCFSNPLSQWMIEMLSVSSFILGNKELNGRILAEAYPSASLHLPEIIDAMRKSCTLVLSHKDYFDNDTKDMEIEPLCLKAFKRRWYLLGKKANGRSMEIFALDRIYSIATTKSHFNLPKHFNAEKFFNDYYGVLLNEKPTKVVLWTTSLRARYLRSLPLHHTQNEVETVNESASQMNDGYSVFEYHIAPTFDFIQELRSLGAEVKVLEPKHLADCLRYDAQMVLDLYK